MKRLPKSVKWLLDFANLGSKPGKVSLMKAGKKNTLNRPPSEPGSLITILSENNKKRDFDFIDENNNLWRKESEKTSFLYSLDDEPSPEELRNFLVKTGINIGSGYSDAKVKWAWFIAICTLHSKYTSGISTDYFGAMAQSFVSDYYNQEQIRLPIRHRKDPKPLVSGIIYFRDNTKDPNCLINGLLYLHDNTLEQVICAYALDFWHNHRELHAHLRQCKCCGKFWIETNTRSKYCCTKCEDRFNQASRQAVRESLRKQRKDLDKKKEDIAHNEIINWLCKTVDCTPKEAEEFYEYEKCKNSNNVKSLAQFKRTCGKNYKNLKN